MTSKTHSATTNCGSDFDCADDNADCYEQRRHTTKSIKQNLPQRCRRAHDLDCLCCRSTSAAIRKTPSSSPLSPSSLKHNRNCSSSATTMRFAWNVAVYVFAAIVLLNTVGLISVANADTVQYPVTAPIGSGLIPPGEFLNTIFSSHFANFFIAKLENFYFRSWLFAVSIVLPILTLPEKAIKVLNICKLLLAPTISYRNRKTSNWFSRLCIRCWT